MSYNETAFLEAQAALATLVKDFSGSGLQPYGAPGADPTSPADQIWVLIAGFMVFFMHAGFTMLEAGSVQHKNSVNICFKNLGTICIGAIMYFLVGYGIAYGTDDAFIGSGNWALTDEADDNSGRHSWFFQMAFAATAATIVSGAVAGRINLIAYFIIAAYLTAFVYPVVSHWIWATGGFLSAFTVQEAPDGSVIPDAIIDGSCGFIDYAGSGVVHMTGGVAALVFAKVLGPRMGRFDADGTPVEIPPHNVALQTLGVFILWFGWYGFNCGSTLAFDGANASKVAVNTTLSPAFAVVTVMIVKKVMTGHFDISSALNAALAGLVSITAGCSTFPEWATCLAGIIGGLVYIAGSKLILKLGVDDPVDAIAVHGINGVWGCVAVGMFADSDSVFAAYSSVVCDGASGAQFGMQIVGVLVIFAWVVALCLPVAIVLKVTGLLRVSADMEAAGLDASEHGGARAFIGDGKVMAAPESA